MLSIEYFTATRAGNRKVRNLTVLVAAILASGWAGQALAADPVRHTMTVDVDPVSHQLKVTDRVELPEELVAEGVDFLLSSALRIVASEPAVESVPVGDVTGFYGINGSSGDLGSDIDLSRYRFAEVPEDGVISVTYEGAIDYGLSDQKEEYTRGFRETAGILGEEGVYLAGSGFWYPYFNDQLLEFNLDIGVPKGWHLISQGNGTSRDESGRAKWDSAGPMDEIYLVGGPLLNYRDSAGAVETLVYLREKDDALASKYLTTTAQYLEMYRDLIGTYPYTKFALVENFWETGYGMPSFTLLGSSIIRFPFILHSSYPHEILHNWWGNSVFVDYETGNWCEGLTAYMADHLVQEQRGKGEDYRRAALQKYRDFVKEDRDFPLSEFRSRHSAATEAVGYGKTLMGFHMLRRHMGDEAFREALVRFYRSQRGHRASFRDVQESLESTTGEDLGWFFDQWVLRAGAASLAVDIAGVEETAEGFVVKGSLRQLQAGEPFIVDVPIAVQTAGETVVRTVRSTGPADSFEIATTDRPQVLHVDPQFDVFRQLDPRETPSSIGQIFGEPEILAVLPSSASRERLEAYRGLMEGWQSDSHSIEVVLDSDLDALPEGKAVWVLGAENRFQEALFEEAKDVVLETSAEEIALAGETVTRSDHSVVVIRRHPENLGKAVGWLVVEPEAAFAGMARKLPHYGKYSYLAFQGEEPTNVLKGQWSATGSPLRVDLRPEGERNEILVAVALPQRAALAELPPVFSQKALMEHVGFLASEALEGRGVGTEGLAKAESHIIQQLESSGLTPGGDDGTWKQTFTLEHGPNGKPLEVSNIIAYLPGTRAEWSDQSVVVSAHYDHLGRGWPDVRQGNEGKIHPGADDNASGVAVLLELARSFASGEKPMRNLVFAFFTAEEGGLHGSKHFVEQPTPFPLEGVRGVINIDTVGRLFDQKVTVLGTGTSEEWQHIFRGVGFVTGIEGRNVPEAAGGSDQMSFIGVGIPGVQIFTKAHTDYHQPGDTADKVDAAGLVKVATFVKESVQYLTEREEPLTVTIASAEGSAKKPAAAPSGPRQGRRVKFGTIPDFAFPGPGVKVDGVVPDSPAARAGLLKGDVVAAIDGQEVGDLRDYSEILKTLEPGQKISVKLIRDGAEITLEATVEAR